jgi:hypothetical protein
MAVVSCRAAFQDRRPMNADYKLIYDVTQVSPPYWFPAAGLVGVVLGVLLLLFGERLPMSRFGP